MFAFKPAAGREVGLPLACGCACRLCSRRPNWSLGLEVWSSGLVAVSCLVYEAGIAGAATPSFRSSTHNPHDSPPAVLAMSCLMILGQRPNS